MPQLKIENIDLRDVFSDVIRVHHCHRDEINAGEIVVVRCNGQIARLVARGHKSKDTFQIDLKTRKALGLRSWNQEVEVQFGVARWWDYLLWALESSQPVIRISAWMSLISLGLGIIGLVLGIISIWMSGVLA